VRVAKAPTSTRAGRAAVTGSGGAFS